MFESTGWILEEPEIGDTSKYDLLTPTIVKPPSSKSYTENMNEISEIGIVQQYQFSSSLQRMSVIVRILGADHFRAYTKGSPEMILSLSKPQTIPQNINVVLQRYTEQGYRVIAIGRTTISNTFTKVQSSFYSWTNIVKNFGFLQIKGLVYFRRSGKRLFFGIFLSIL